MGNRVKIIRLVIDYFTQTPYGVTSFRLYVSLPLKTLEQTDVFL